MNCQIHLCPVVSKFMDLHRKHRQRNMTKGERRRGFADLEIEVAKLIAESKLNYKKLKNIIPKGGQNV